MVHCACNGIISADRQSEGICTGNQTCQTVGVGLLWPCFAISNCKTSTSMDFNKPLSRRQEKLMVREALSFTISAGLLGKAIMRGVIITIRKYKYGVCGSLMKVLKVSGIGHRNH